MAEVRISGLPTTGSAGLTDELETNTAGAAPSVKRTLAQLHSVAGVTHNLASGSVSAPSLYLNSETGSGLYRIAANNIGVAISGAKVLDISSSGLGVTGAITGTTYLQLADTYDLRWGDGSTFIAGNSTTDVIQFATVGVERGRFTSTGLEVTGTVTSTFSGAVSTFTRTGVNAAGAVQVAYLVTDSKTAADGIFMPFNMLNASSATKNYAGITGSIVSPTAGAENGSLKLGVISAGTYTDVATVSTTGLAVTGTLSATGDVTASGGNILSTSGGAIPIRVSGATTGYSVLRIANTGGEAFFGQENSAGNNLIVGGSAYDTVIRGPSGLAFSANAGAAMQMRLSSSGLAVTGTLSATGKLSTSTSYLLFGGSTAGAAGEVWVGPDGGGGLFLNAPTGENVAVGSNNSAIGVFSSTGLAVTGSVGITQSGQAQIINGATGTYSTWQYNGTSVGDIGTADEAVGGSTADFGITSRAGSLVLGTGSTSRMSINGSGSVAISGTGPHAIGSATIATNQWTQSGTFAGARAFVLTSTLTLASGDTGYGVLINPTFTEFSSGTHSIIAGLYVQPAITNGGATTTDAFGTYLNTFAAATGTTRASTLYLEGATGATTNYAIWAASGSVRIDGTGPHAIGGVTNSEIQWAQQGSFSGSASAQGYRLISTLSPTAGNDAYGMYLTPTLVEAGSGTHGTFASLVVSAPTITGGAASLTNAASLYITGAPTGGTNNYALWSSGNTRWDSGYLKASGDTTYSNLAGSFHELRSTQEEYVAFFTNKNATNPYGLVLQYTAADPNGTGNLFLYCEGNGTQRASIRSNGGLANYSANDVNLSDATVKRDKGATADHTAFVKALAYRKFSYLDDQTDSDVDGLMAQDVQALDPSLVTEFSEGKLGIYTHRLQERINSVIPSILQRLDQLENA